MGDINTIVSGHCKATPYNSTDGHKSNYFLQPLSHLASSVVSMVILHEVEGLKETKNEEYH